MFSDYYRLAYTHNPLADFLLFTLLDDVDSYLPRFRLMIQGDTLVNSVFAPDFDTASIAWLREVKAQENELNYSLFFSHIYQAFIEYKLKPYKKDFPLGLPRTHEDNYFVLEDGIDWVIDHIPAAPKPFLGYYHFLPPHHPYNTRLDMFQTFARDGFVLPEKPATQFTRNVPYKELEAQNWRYDEFILYVDAEFARLHQSLEKAGVLDNTWLILTSDHGELFERGIRGHDTKTLFHSLINVPLMIFEPGQTSRRDVYENTSAADLLPTLLRITGRDTASASWAEGRVLPPFRAPDEQYHNRVYTMECKELPANHPMTFGAITIIEDNYKLVYTYGYPEIGYGELFELFDLQTDPEELNNLFFTRKDIFDRLFPTLQAELEMNDRPYQGGASS